MRKEIITIADNGVVSVPNKVEMTIVEIANLFGIYYQTAKRCVRDIEKSNMASGDYTISGTVEGLKVYPDYYGLAMIIAVAFRVQSVKAEIFRQWIMKKVVRHDITTMLVLPLQNSMLN